MKNERTINKIIKRINNSSKRTNMPFLVAIGGCGASGKTHLALELSNRFKKKEVNILNLDGYYYNKDYRRKLNITGCNINSVRLHLLKHHLANIKRRKNFKVPKEKVNNESSFFKKRYSSKKINIIDGLTTMFKPLIHYYDLIVFIECSDKTQLERRIKRDKNKRNLDLNEIRRVFDHRNYEFKKYLLPQRRVADIVLYSQKNLKLSFMKGLS